jgi:hypothetical protein
MCLIMQGISQLDEHYGRTTRMTALTGSQIKLFVSVNDLATSEFVSEMLGDTTEIYRTPAVGAGDIRPARLCAALHGATVAFDARDVGSAASVARAQRWHWPRQTPPLSGAILAGSASLFVHEK